MRCNLGFLLPCFWLTSQQGKKEKNWLAKEGLHPDEFVGAIHGVKGRCRERSERSLPKG